MGATGIQRGVRGARAVNSRAARTGQRSADAGARTLHIAETRARDGRDDEAGRVRHARASHPKGPAPERLVLTRPRSGALKLVDVDAGWRLALAH